METPYFKNLRQSKLETSEQAFTKIITSHQRTLVQLAYRLVGNLEDAKDLAQWAFAKLWLHHERVDNEKEVFYYLRKILVNLCIDHLRRRGKAEPEVEFEENQFSSDHANPLQQLEAQELQHQLWSCIEALKPKQKATLILRDLEGYSVEETASILDCTKNNVLCNVHLARENVRRKIQQWLAIA